MSVIMSIRYRMAVVLLWCLCLTRSAEASHFRGADMWATIDANGVVKLTARTRWREGTAPFPFAGIDSSRFGLTNFNCPDGSSVTLTPAAGMRILRASDGAVVYSWPTNSFSLTATTVATDTSHDGYAERTQEIFIPLGSMSVTGQVNSPLRLPHGAYDIVWNDWSRIRGIRNIAPTDGCGRLNSGYGGRVRVIWNGVAARGPNLSASFLPVVPRSFDYSQNLNATSPDGRSMFYRLMPLNPYYPDFGPATQVPGLTLDQTGQVRIPASATRSLLDNYYGEPAGAYVISVEIGDSAGWISKRDGLLAPATTSNRPPVLDPVPSQTIQAGQTVSFTVRATDPDTQQQLTLAATGLPPGASFNFTRGNPAVGTFTWTPTETQAGGAFGINFEVHDTGTAALGYQDILSDSEHSIITVEAANRAPTLQTVDNLRVGVDPLRLRTFVNQTLQFDVLAIDPNQGDTLTYSLPILLDPNGVNRATDASLGFSVSTFTDDSGRRVGRYTWTPTESAIGVWQATLRVDDGRGGHDQAVVSISVGTFTNQSPMFTLAPPRELFIQVGETVSFSMTAQDSDSGQRVTLRGTGRPAGSSFPEAVTGNPVSATFSWTPSATQAGVFNLNFMAEDDGSPPIIQTYETVIHVSSPNTIPPVIYSMAPGRGPTEGGTPVTLHGSGFSGQVSVNIGGQPVRNLVVVNSGTLTFSTPPGPAGLADVVVTASGNPATLSGGFLYFEGPPPPPAVTSPTDGFVSMSTSVPVRGIGVPGATVDAYDGNTWVGSFPVGVDGSFSGTVTLDYGEHSLTFTQTTANGTSQPTAPISGRVVQDTATCRSEAGSFHPTGRLTESYLRHTATLLVDGRVLVVGGYDRKSEVYDPATGMWGPTGSPHTIHRYHTATLLTDGRVLVAGGEGARADRLAEVYDPATNSWTLTGNLLVHRLQHAAVRLTDGRVLVMGGMTPSGKVQATAEVYDPATGSWSLTGSMAQARRSFTATLLVDGRVLVAGGAIDSSSDTCQQANCLASAEVYDPATGTWAAINGMGTARGFYAAALLADGKVLVAGGGADGTVSATTAEVYDPATHSWSTTGRMASPRRYHTLTALPGGKVLVLGGYDRSKGIISLAEVYNPITGTWDPACSMKYERYKHMATLLQDGRVLITAGYSNGDQQSAELFVPAASDLGGLAP